VRHRSFTRAAAELGLTPAAVSLRIRDLEAHLGIALFFRSGPRIAPLQAAIDLATAVAEALTIVSDAVGLCRGSSAPIRVTAVPTLAARWLTPRLSEYYQHSDAIPVELDVSTDERPREAFDVHIRTGNGEWPGYEAIPLFVIDATPMLSPRLAADHRISTPADLMKLPLLPHDEWSTWFRAAECDPTELRIFPGRYPSNELNALAAVESAGVALLSPRFYGPLIQDGQLVRPFELLIEGPAWHYVLVSAGEARPDVRQFCSWLVSERGPLLISQ
jgi:LysR family glycine cleavage system transcriptional activator